MRFFPLSVVVVSTACELSSVAQATELSLPSTRVPFTLTASLQGLNSSPGQTQKLQEWVRKGGVLRVSTDAATLFGFSVVKPRERTFARAGQRFGRAIFCPKLPKRPRVLGSSPKWSWPRGASPCCATMLFNPLIVTAAKDCNRTTE